VVVIGAATAIIGAAAITAAITPAIPRPIVLPPSPLLVTVVGK
jgi:hypothetical protein